MYEAVCGSAPRRLRAERLVSVSSRGQLERLLLHPDKDYVSLATVRQAQSLYGLYLKSEGPFGAVSASERTYIQQALWIRNAIAHSSESAISIFRTKVPGVTSLPMTRRNPGPFLRHEFRTNPAQRRFELYCHAFVSAAEDMSKAWTAVR